MDSDSDADDGNAAEDHQLPPEPLFELCKHACTAAAQIGKEQGHLDLNHAGVEELFAELLGWALADVPAVSLAGWQCMAMQGGVFILWLPQPSDGMADALGVQRNHPLILVACRGSGNQDDWTSNFLRSHLVELNGSHHLWEKTLEDHADRFVQTFGTVIKGSWAALTGNFDEVREIAGEHCRDSKRWQVFDGVQGDKKNNRVFREIGNRLDQEDLRDATVLLTGHSRGAALATLLTWRLHMTKGLGRDRLRLITFCSPRVFNAVVADKFNEELEGVHHRYYHENDIVPRVAPKYWGYQHCGLAHEREHPEDDDVASVDSDDDWVDQIRGMTAAIKKFHGFRILRHAKAAPGN